MSPFLKGGNYEVDPVMGWETWVLYRIKEKVFSRKKNWKKNQNERKITTRTGHFANLQSPVCGY